MRISIIAALSTNRVIGKNNDLPWHLPDDMNFFMTTTKGHCIVMGRKNYESIPTKFRPLKDRTNIIITKQKKMNMPGCFVFNAISEAIQFANDKNEKELFIIGGSQIYELALPITHRLYLTEINANVQGDTFFPHYDSSLFKETSRRHHPADNKHIYSFDFVVYDRVHI